MKMVIRLLLSLRGARQPYIRSGSIGQELPLLRRFEGEEKRKGRHSAKTPQNAGLQSISWDEPIRRAPGPGIRGYGDTGTRYKVLVNHYFYIGALGSPSLEESVFKQSNSLFRDTILYTARAILIVNY